MQIRYLKSLLLFSSFATSIYAASYTVNTNTDTGTGVGTTGDLRFCLTQVNTVPAASNSVNFNLTSPNNVIGLTSNMHAIAPASGATTTTITNTGDTVTINGLFQPLFSYRGTINFDGGTNKVIINNTQARGGIGGVGSGGGGGGAGMGGGLFVKGGNTVTISNITFSGTNAQGGKGGDSGMQDGGGGGGGIFGTGGACLSAAGGGGGGIYGNGGSGTTGGGGGGR